MPSKQSEAVRRHWEVARLAMADPTADAPDNESWGDYTESELYEMMTDVYSYVFELLWSEPHVLTTNTDIYSSILTRQSR